MKRIFCFIVVSCLQIFGQTDTIRSKIPEIELPDFVITGQATVELPQQKKSIPDLITPLSKEFILPRIKIQELKLEGLSDPAKQKPSIIDTSTKFFGRLRAALGLYSLPEGDLFYSGKVNKYNFSFGGKIINSKDYEKNSKFLRTNLFLNNSLIIEKENQPPARLNINSKFDLLKYSYFKSFSSDTFSTISQFKLFGNFENLFYREFNLNIGGNFDFQKFGRWDYNFAEVSVFGMLRSTFEHFELTALAQPFLYKVSKDSTKNTLILSAYSELYFRKLFNTLNIIGRVDYQTEKEDSSLFLAPSLRLGFGLSDYWTLTIFYENKIINKTPADLWFENPYLNKFNFNYSIERIKNKFGLGTIIYFDRTSNLKIEFSRYNIAGRNNYIIDTLNPGYFKIFKGENEAIELNTFIYLDFTKYGNLLFNLRYLNSRLKLTTRQAPHTPKLHSKLTYSYSFEIPLYLRFSFSYNSISYGDINQKTKIDPYYNINLEADYQILSWLNLSVELNNLLNRKNYLWYNYNEKPFDILFNIKTRI
ncbi:MAG: hypothetical protein N3F03_04425 [Ignavibacteria bacterium]|nr:hypothetical protein [Ignavibacteria bacterium]